MAKDKKARISTAVKIAIAAVAVIALVAISNFTNQQMIAQREDQNHLPQNENNVAPVDNTKSGTTEYLEISAISNFVKNVADVYGRANDGVVENDTAKVTDAWSDMKKLKTDIDGVISVPKNAEEAHKALTDSANEYFSAVDCLLASNTYANAGNLDEATEKINESIEHSGAAMTSYQNAMILLK